MLGIVIPAHNEQEALEGCLIAAQAAAACPRLGGEQVELLVVLDACTDHSGAIARRLGAGTLAVQVRNVGAARSAGADALLARGARWLAFTDADTEVSPGWLADQLSLRADVVCGTVGVDDWSPHAENAGLLQAHFRLTYHDRDGHRHVHGANLGVAADAYRRVGGFDHLACSEDVALVKALEASGANIAWSALPRVNTSARRQARCIGGFADALKGAVAQRLASPGSLLMTA